MRHRKVNFVNPVVNIKILTPNTGFKNNSIKSTPKNYGPFNESQIPDSQMEINQLS